MLKLIYFLFNTYFTGQSQESEESYKPAKIKEVHSKLHSFQASLCTLTATHLTLIHVCNYIWQASRPKFVGNTGRIEPVNAGLTFDKRIQTSSYTT